MASITVKLKHGWKIGETVHQEVILRELTPEDIVEASLESERAVMTEHGYQFMVSPTLMGVNSLLRQIEKVGDFNGAITRKMLARLDREDFERLQMESELLDQAAMEAVTERGRTDASGGDTGNNHYEAVSERTGAK
jgi:phage FluMu protein gp41